MRYRRILIEGASYCFTVVTHRRRPLFSDPLTVQLLIDSIAAVRQRHPFKIEAQVILPDHLHALWTLPDGDARYATRWRLIKEAFTRAYCHTHIVPERTEVARARGEQPVWQRRFWEHMISNEREFADCLDYLHRNPVHHGLVSSPRDWPHSTIADWVERSVYEPTWGSDESPKLPEWARCHEDN